MITVHAPRIRQLVRYGAVSLIATSVSMTVLGGLVATGAVAATWANVIATAVGTVPSYELNRRWVWGRTGRRGLVAEVGPFCVLSFAGLALSTVAVGGPDVAQMRRSPRNPVPCRPPDPGA